MCRPPAPPLSHLLQIVSPPPLHTLLHTAFPPLHLLLCLVALLPTSHQMIATTHHRWTEQYLQTTHLQILTSLMTNCPQTSPAADPPVTAPLTFPSHPPTALPSHPPTSLPSHPLSPLPSHPPTAPLTTIELLPPVQQWGGPWTSSCPSSPTGATLLILD